MGGPNQLCRVWRRHFRLSWSDHYRHRSLPHASDCAAYCEPCGVLAKHCHRGIGIACRSTGSRGRRGPANRLVQIGGFVDDIRVDVDPVRWLRGPSHHGLLLEAEIGAVQPALLRCIWCARHSQLQALSQDEL